MPAADSYDLSSPENENSNDNSDGSHNSHEDMEHDNTHGNHSNGNHVNGVHGNRTNNNKENIKSPVLVSILHKPNSKPRQHHASVSLKFPEEGHFEVPHVVQVPSTPPKSTTFADHLTTPDPNRILKVSEKS